MLLQPVRNGRLKVRGDEMTVSIRLIILQEQALDPSFCKRSFIGGMPAIRLLTALTLLEGR